jgi:hypothetical protein
MALVQGIYDLGEPGREALKPSFETVETDIEKAERLASQVGANYWRTSN